MNSYFTNPSLSCHLTGPHDVLPNVALSNSSTYDPVVRHFPSSYGAGNRMYRAPFYQPQDDVMFGSGRGPYDYGSNSFYPDKDGISGCRQSFAQDFTSSSLSSSCQDTKSSSIQIYPWMQRMNSHSGEFLIYRCFFRRTRRMSCALLLNLKKTRLSFYCPVLLSVPSPPPDTKAINTLTIENINPVWSKTALDICLPSSLKND